MTAPSQPSLGAGGGGRRARRGAIFGAAAGLGIAALVAVPPIARDAAEGRADGRALLVVAEDVAATDAVGAPWRLEERRADAILLFRWHRACNRLEVLSIPRDLVAAPGGQTLSITYGVEGAPALRRAIDRLFGVDVFAQVAMDLDDVRDLADRVGPVTVTLPRASRDLRTGFAAGQGPVPLDGTAAVAYLRSRTWEEQRDGAWVLSAADDLGRIERAQAFGAAVLDRVGHGGVLDHLRLGEALLRHGRVMLGDPVAAAGFLAGIDGVHDVVFDTVEVRPERSVDERRSPFAPDDLGAMARYVLPAGEVARVRAAGCSPSTERVP
jgi:LCP family protein required for cell wall assembly